VHEDLTRQGNIAHLHERLSESDQERTSKIFRDSAVIKLDEFIARYFEFNRRTDDRLDELITLAQHALEGVTPQGLRSNQASRRLLAARLSWIQVSLDVMRNHLQQQEVTAKS
jgi:hypothetical protein